MTYLLKNNRLFDVLLSLVILLSVNNFKTNAEEIVSDATVKVIRTTDDVKNKPELTEEKNNTKLPQTNDKEFPNSLGIIFISLSMVLVYAKSKSYKQN